MRTLLLFVPMAIVLGGLTFSTISYKSNGGPRDYLQTFSSGPYGNGIIGFYPGVFGQDNLANFATMKKRTKGSKFDRKWSHQQPIAYAWDPYRYILRQMKKKSNEEETDSSDLWLRY